MFKNLRSFWKGRHFLDEVYGEFREMLEGAERMFGMVCRAWAVENRIAKLCDSLVERIAKAPLSTNRAVCYALIARHFKRIVAHLTNIATSTILPLSDIDYFVERGLGESITNV